MTRHGSGMRCFPCLMAGMTWLVVGGPAAAWANTEPWQADERGPRLQITAPGKMARLPQPPQQIDSTTTASIPRVSADQRVERAFANPTKSEIALGLVPGWAAPAFVAHLTPLSAVRPREEPVLAPVTERPVPRKVLDPRRAFLAFPLGDEEAVPLERMGGGYLASYVPDPLLQLEDEPPTPPETSPEAPSQALTAPPEELPEPADAQPKPAEAPPQASITPPEALPEPVEAQPEPAEALTEPEASPKPPEAQPKPPVVEAAPPPAAETETQSAKSEAPAAPVVRSPAQEPVLPPSLLPTRPPLTPG